MADLFGATLQEHPSSSDSDSLGMEDAAQDVPGGGMGTQKQAALLRMDDEDGANAMLRINLGHGDCCDIPAALVLPTAKLEFRGVGVWKVFRKCTNITSTTSHPHPLNTTVLDECTG